jgi:uncharacterized membrane protein HdeD (DUF308 family)
MLDARARSQVVIDRAELDAYVREAQATVLAGATYVVGLGLFALLRVFLDVPYLRAAVGLFVLAAGVGLLVKRRIHGLDRTWLVASATLGLAAHLVVLVSLVDRSRGTIFAEAAALLVGLSVTHVLDRVAARRA